MPYFYECHDDEDEVEDDGAGGNGCGWGMGTTLLVIELIPFLCTTIILVLT